MNESTQQHYVGFWARLLATLIDSLILVLITWPPLLALYGDSYLLRTEAQLVLGPGHVLISYVLPTLLVIWLWRRFRATPGKMLIKAEIVDADSGLSPSVKQATIRYFAYLASFLPLCLGFVWIAFDKRKQGFHDKLAGTVVVYRRG